MANLSSSSNLRRVEPTITSSSPVFSTKKALSATTIVALSTIAGLSVRSSAARSLLTKSLRSMSHQFELYAKMPTINQTMVASFKSGEYSGVKNTIRRVLQEKGVGRKVDTLYTGFAQNVKNSCLRMKEASKKKISEAMTQIHNATKKGAEFIEKNPKLTSAVLGTMVEAGLMTALQNSYGETESEKDLHGAFEKHVSSLETQVNESKQEMAERLHGINDQIRELEELLNDSKIPLEQKRIVQQNLAKLSEYANFVFESEGSAYNNITSNLSDIKTDASFKKSDLEKATPMKEFLRQSAISGTGEAIGALMIKNPSIQLLTPLVTSTVAAVLDIATHTDATVAKAAEYHDKLSNVHMKSPAVTSESEAERPTKKAEPFFGSSEELLSKAITGTLKAHYGSSGIVKAVTAATVSGLGQDVSSGTLVKGKGDEIAEKCLQPIATQISLHKKSFEKSCDYFETNIQLIKNILTPPSNEMKL